MSAKFWENEPNVTLLREAYDLRKSNPDLAIRKLSALAECGSGMAMYYLGNSYRAGLGVPTDLSEAEKWYKRSADQGCIPGAHMLGRYYYFDLKDYEKAAAAFSVPQLANYSPALHALGTMYLRGLGVTQDLAKARAYLEKAAALGHIYATGSLARLLMRGNFGWRQRFRGGWLFLRGLVIGLRTKFRDPQSERIG